jgi:hypothetical protein
MAAAAIRIPDPKEHLKNRCKARIEKRFLFEEMLNLRAGLLDDVLRTPVTVRWLGVTSPPQMLTPALRQKAIADMSFREFLARQVMVIEKTLAVAGGPVIPLATRAADLGGRSVAELEALLQMLNSEPIEGPRYVDFTQRTGLAMEMRATWLIVDGATEGKPGWRYYHFACDLESKTMAYGPLNPRSFACGLAGGLSGHNIRFWELNRHFGLKLSIMQMEGDGTDAPTCVAGYVARQDDEVEFIDQTGHFHLNYTADTEATFQELLGLLQVGTVEFRHIAGRPCGAAGPVHRVRG